MSEKLTDKLVDNKAKHDSFSSDKQSPPSYDQDYAIPPPDITLGFNNLNLAESDGADLAGSRDSPSVDECIAHLKVLECFYRLRQQIASTDGLYGVDNSIVYDQRHILKDEEISELLAKLGEKRWSVYLSRAVDRFESWINNAVSSTGMLKCQLATKTAQEYMSADAAEGSKPLRFTPDTMPPPDVLMVWHAYVLNPRVYLEDCCRYGRMQLWYTSFPWKAAAQCINSANFVYESTANSRDHFQRLTGLVWDNLDDAREKVVCCPCGAKVSVPWTTCAERGPTGEWTNPKFLNTGIDIMLSGGSGFSDKDFLAICSTCNSQITHERLKAHKFCQDVTQLCSSDIAMAGTLLGRKGIPFAAGAVVDRLAEQQFETCNNLFKRGLGAKILSQASLGGQGNKDSLDGIREIMEVALKDLKYMALVRPNLPARMGRPARMAIRKMMSRYWETSSPFALDLVGAVIRQGSFVEKMHNIDWLHSPALPATMKRLLLKYQRFLAIIAANDRMAVPTLDVDLAWHTHQLNPAGYFHYTTAHMGQFLDHDDKVAETRLNDAFAWTSKTYQKRYQEPYSECTCWYCEAVRESHTSSASRLFRTKTSQVNEQLHDTVQDPRKSVHISAHNAIRPEDHTLRYGLAAERHAQELDRAYIKACERARKKGKPEPKKDDYYYSDAYGYPVYMPAYAPYVGPLPYAPGYYAGVPGCMAVGAGASGACCNGTCGGVGGAAGCGGFGSCGGVGGSCGGGGCGGGGGGCGGGGGGCGGGGGGGGGGCGGGG